MILESSPFQLNQEFTLSLPGDCKVLDVRTIAGVPTLFYLHSGAGAETLQHFRALQAGEALPAAMGFDYIGHLEAMRKHQAGVYLIFKQV